MCYQHYIKCRNKHCQNSVHTLDVIECSKKPLCERELVQIHFAEANTRVFCQSCPARGQRRRINKRRSRAKFKAKKEARNKNTFVPPAPPPSPNKIESAKNEDGARNEASIPIITSRGQSPPPQSSSQPSSADSPIWSPTQSGSDAVPFSSFIRTILSLSRRESDAALPCPPASHLPGKATLQQELSETNPPHPDVVLPRLPAYQLPAKATMQQEPSGTNPPQSYVLLPCPPASQLQANYATEAVRDRPRRNQHA